MKCATPADTPGFPGEACLGHGPFATTRIRADTKSLEARPQTHFAGFLIGQGLTRCKGIHRDECQELSFPVESERASTPRHEAARSSARSGLIALIMGVFPSPSPQQELKEKDSRRPRPENASSVRSRSSTVSALFQASRQVLQHTGNLWPSIGVSALTPRLLVRG